MTCQLISGTLFKQEYCCCSQQGRPQGKARQVYLYSTFQHKVIQSALQKMEDILKMAFKISH